MDNPISRSAQSSLSQYANYDEKQLLSRGAIGSCFVSVLCRLHRNARLSIGWDAAINVAVVAFIVWLAYSSATVALICFSPVFLTVLWESSATSRRICQLLARLTTIAELWREHEQHDSNSIDHKASVSQNPENLIAR